MLDHETRIAVLRLRSEGHGMRAIARVLNVSRNAVRRVIEDGGAEVPTQERPERLAPELETIRTLHAACKGNLVRVHEELLARDIEASYQCLTAFCRRHHIGYTPKQPAGQYHFEPGEEMQHDTSPHVVRIGEQEVKLQCASLVLCYSRMIYAQVYRRWTRFECRVFLSEAIVAFEGAAARCMLDNSSVIIAHGSGPDAVPADAMKAFGDRFGFQFAAHRVGDANRSARVERPFDYIEDNFYPGRAFRDDDDLNTQLRAWCDRANRKPKRSLPSPPIELWVAERPALKPLPIFVPEVYDVHTRRIDVEGFVNLHNNRYSVPGALIGRQVEARETARRIRIYDGHRLLADHDRITPGVGARCTLPEHRIDRKPRVAPVPHSPEEKLLRAQSPCIDRLCDLLRKHHGGGAVRAIRRLHRIYLDYPTESLIAAAEKAIAYGLLDLGRLETMVLRAVAGDFFRLPIMTQGEEQPRDQEERQTPIPRDPPDLSDITLDTGDAEPEPEPELDFDIDVIDDEDDPDV